MRTQRRSNCPVACTLDVLGDRWTLLLVRDLALGKQRFEAFLASPEGIASNILANRLARLTSAGIVEQHPNPDHRGRATYHLTERGNRLKPVLDAVAHWGLENLRGTRVGSRAPSGTQPGRGGRPTKRRLRSDR